MYLTLYKCCPALTSFEHFWLCLLRSVNHLDSSEISSWCQESDFSVRPCVALISDRLNKILNLTRQTNILWAFPFIASTSQVTKVYRNLHLVSYKMLNLTSFFNYRLITAYLLLRVNLDKIMHARWDFDASSARTRRVSALDKHQNWSASALCCLNSRAQCKYTVVNLIHTRRKQAFFVFHYVIIRHISTFNKVI